MPAVLILTREEAGIVCHGGVPEPSFRPLHDRYDDEEEWEDEGDEDGLREGRASDTVSPPPIQDGALERVLAAEYWTRHATHLVLLVEPADTDDDRQIVALARSVGGPRAASPGTRRVTIGPWVTLSPPLPLATLRDDLAKRLQNYFTAALGSYVRPLPPATGQAVEAAIRARYPEYSDHMDHLARIVLPARRPRERLGQRDATATALSALTPQWRSLRPVQYPVPSTLAHGIDAALVASENDFITDDAEVFPGWNRSHRSKAGWWEFEHHGRRMWIKNVNVSVAESRTGADLVYVRTAPDAVILVQYKLLKEDQGGSYLPGDPRLPGQVDRMLSFESEPPATGSTDDFRLGPDFSFVKFIGDQGDHGLGDQELTRGYYLSARYVRDMLPRPSKGPLGGLRYYIDAERTIGAATFAELLRAGWVGSQGDTTEVLRGILRAPAAAMTIAVDQPPEAV